MIRSYTPSDKNKIIGLLRLNTPRYFSENEEKDLVYYLDNHSDNYYVLEIENDIVACGGFNIEREAKTAKISWDIIHPDYQGKGLGTQLMNHRINEIEKINRITMLSVRTSQLVYKFYEKFGLELQEIVKDYWDKGFDLYRMDCPLHSAVKIKNTNISL